MSVWICPFAEGEREGWNKFAWSIRLSFCLWNQQRRNLSSRATIYKKRESLSLRDTIYAKTNAARTRDVNL